MQIDSFPKRKLQSTEFQRDFGATGAGAGGMSSSSQLKSILSSNCTAELMRWMDLNFVWTKPPTASFLHIILTLIFRCCFGIFFWASFLAYSQELFLEWNLTPEPQSSVHQCYVIYLKDVDFIQWGWWLPLNVTRTFGYSVLAVQLILSPSLLIAIWQRILSAGIRILSLQRLVYVFRIKCKQHFQDDRKAPKTRRKNLDSHQKMEWDVCSPMLIDGSKTTRNFRKILEFRED